MAAPYHGTEELPVPSERESYAEDSVSLSSNVSLESLDSADDNAISHVNQITPKASQRLGTRDQPHTLYENSKRTKSRLSSVNNNTRLSKITTTQSNRSSVLGLDDDNIVPKSQRRGLLSFMAVIAEYDNARMYPNKIKYCIVFVIAICSIIGPMGTSIMLPAIDAIADDFNTTVAIVNISVGIYLFTLGFFPLYWSAYSEAFGRRSIYVVSFLLLVAFSIGCALSTSIGMLIVFRILSGGCAASVQSVGAGTIGDLYPPQERGRAMGIYYLGPLGGPLFAPILGGVLGETLGWRSTQWFLVIFGGVCCVMIIFCLPETLRKEDNREAIRRILALRRRKPRDIEEKLGHSSEEIDDEQQREDEEIRRILTNQSIRSIQRSIVMDEEEEQLQEQEVIADSHVPSLSRVHTNRNTEMYERLKQRNLEKLRSKVEELDDLKIQNQTKWQKFKKDAYFFLFKPLKSVVFLRCPSVLFSILYCGPLFSCTYFLNMSLTYAYSRPPYNFSEIIVGLVYIPNSVSYIIASIWGGKWTDKLLKDYAKKHNGELVPEARIGINVWIAAALFPLSLLIAGWCLDQGTHWVTPLIGTVIFGFASMIVIGTTITYLVDALPGRGATGVALNNLVRMTLATIACFVTEPLIRALGIGVLFSILAGLSAVFAIVLLILKKRGTYWRETYDLERLYDLLD